MESSRAGHDRHAGGVPPEASGRAEQRLYAESVRLRVELSAHQAAPTSLTDLDRRPRVRHPSHSDAPKPDGRARCPQQHAPVPLAMLSPKTGKLTPLPLDKADKNQNQILTAAPQGLAKDAGAKRPPNFPTRTK